MWSRVDRLGAVLCLMMVFLVFSCKKGEDVNPVICPHVSVHEGEFVDGRDCQVYPTVTINGTTWMAANLNYVDEDIELLGTWCYDNLEQNCDRNGRLYNWLAAMNGDQEGGQCLCADGWHLPTDEEWQQLERDLGMTDAVAKAIGERGTDQGDQLKIPADCLSNPNCGSSGMNCRFSGLRLANNQFTAIGSEAYYWSSTQDQYGGALGRGVKTISPKIERVIYGKTQAFAIRCVKNQ